MILGKFENLIDFFNEDKVENLYAIVLWMLHNETLV